MSPAGAKLAKPRGCFVVVVQKGGYFVKRKADTPCAFTTSDSWVILSPIERSIKRKIEAVGTPLKEWNIQIRYGVKTGCDKAFIIDETKRAEILSWCKDDAERARTEQIIRPIASANEI